MSASVGDRIVTASGVVGGPVRDGVIIEVQHPDGTPPYLVEWSDTGARTLVFPGADSHVEHVPGMDGPPLETVAAVWRVQVTVVEAGDRTTAEAVLVADPAERLHALGRARRDPRDEPIPLIGDRIAVARALRRLADRLLDEAEGGIEDSTGAPAHVHP